MPTGAVLAIVIACLLIALAAGVAATLEMRLAMTHRQFGPEFDRLARRLGHRRARAELTARKRRVARLPIHPLSPERARQLATSWNCAQEQFVDDPATAVASAAELVRSVARERGYEVDDPERMLADLSVAHARRVENYRRAQEMTASKGSASTEDLRHALLWYRALFRDLAGAGSQSRRPEPLRRLALSVRRPAL